MNASFCAFCCGERGERLQNNLLVCHDNPCIKAAALLSDNWGRSEDHIFGPSSVSNYIAHVLEFAMRYNVREQRRVVTSPLHECEATCR